MKKITLFFLIICCLNAIAGSKNKQLTTEPIVIKAGIPTVIIAAVFDKDDKNADPFYSKREYAELQNNFPDYNILLIEEPCFAMFENQEKDIYSFKLGKKSVEVVIFWDGKKESSIKITEAKVKLTEYISQLTSQNKQSSYIAENDKLLKEYNRKKKLFNPDKNAKSLSQYYIIDKFFNKMIYGNTEFFKPQNYKGINSVTVYSRYDEEPEELAFKMNFNAKNQVTDILYAKRMNSKGSVFMTFSYDENGLLKKMISNENIDNNIQHSIAEFAYENDRIIEYSVDCMWEYSIQKGILFNHSYIEFTNIEKDFRINTSNEEIKDTCWYVNENGSTTHSYCASSFDGKLPYHYNNTIYKDGVPDRRSISKIEQTDKGIFTIYKYITVTKEFQKAGEVVIGANGLTERTAHSARKQGYKLRFEYR